MPAVTRDWIEHSRLAAFMAERRSEGEEGAEEAEEGSPQRRELLFARSIA